MRALSSAAALLFVMAVGCARSPAAPAVAPGATGPVGGNIDRGTLGVSPTKALFLPGETQAFSAVPQQIFTSRTAIVTWSIDDPRVATVDAEGRLAAIGEGFTWLRAKGDEGTAAHPISVSTAAPLVVTGTIMLEACSSANVMTCSAVMKGSQVRHPMSMTYRAGPFGVIAEVWFQNNKNLVAAVGEINGANELQFSGSTFRVPQLSMGAGGCCEVLSGFTAALSGQTLTRGEFTLTSSDATLRYRIVGS